MGDYFKRRDSAAKHASRSWTCPCGRTVRGNGGKSSHQRACPHWKLHRMYALLGNIERVEQGDGPWRTDAARSEYRESCTREAEAIQQDLIRSWYSTDDTVDEAWEKFHLIEPNVLASWGEQRGRWPYGHPNAAWRPTLGGYRR